MLGKNGYKLASNSGNNNTTMNNKLLRKNVNELPSHKDIVSQSGQCIIYILIIMLIVLLYYYGYFIRI